MAGVPVFRERFHGQWLLGFGELVLGCSLQFLELLRALVALAQKFLEGAKGVGGELAVPRVSVAVLGRKFVMCPAVETRGERHTERHRRPGWSPLQLGGFAGAFGSAQLRHLGGASTRHKRDPFHLGGRR